jgi:hypothetical protein
MTLEAIPNWPNITGQYFVCHDTDEIAEITNSRSKE